MTESPNLQTLSAAYRTWVESKGSRTEQWLDVVAPDVAMVSHAGGKPGPGIRPTGSGHNAVVDYLDDVTGNWAMRHFTVERFVDGGDEIAAVVDCAWTNKRTGKAYAGRMAHFWTFRDGKVTRFEEFLDTAELIAAATL